MVQGTNSDARKRIQEAREGAPFSEGARVVHTGFGAGVIVTPGKNYSYVRFDNGATRSAMNAYMDFENEDEKKRHQYEALMQLRQKEWLAASLFSHETDESARAMGVEPTSDYIRRLIVERNGFEAQVRELTERVEKLERRPNPFAVIG